MNKKKKKQKKQSSQTRRKQGNELKKDEEAAGAADLRGGREGAAEHTQTHTPLPHFHLNFLHPPIISAHKLELRVSKLFFELLKHPPCSQEMI